jgi:tRNA A-37 threonylcarbamoyl transferase component Bud32
MFILYNEILDIIEELYDNNIDYYDSNSTNFVFKDNNVHLIDFDYKHISYKNNRKSLYKVLIGIDDLVDRMNNRFLAHDEFIYFPRSFNSMRKHLVKLENRIRKG